MRITIIGPAYPLRGGIAHHTYWLRQELAGRGHSIQVISFRKLYPRLMFPGTTEIDTSRLKLDAGAESILTPLGPMTWLKAFRAITDFGPEVVVFQWWQPFFGPLVGTLAKYFRKSGIKIVIECHNVFPHERSPLDRLLLKFAFSSADHLITHSASDQNDLAVIAPSKPISVSSLPALEEFSAHAAPSRAGRTILFFGKVRKYKGLSVLLEAMPSVLERLDCQLEIVGEVYDSTDKYRRLAKELGIENHVRIHDRYVPNEEVPGVFEQADVLVLPYVSASQSGVAQIAFSNALPVIASSVGGLSEAVTNNVNGLLFPSGDSEALAERIAHYFTNNLGPVFSSNLRASIANRRTAADIIEEVAASNSVVTEHVNFRAAV